MNYSFTNDEAARALSRNRLSCLDAMCDGLEILVSKYQT